MTITFAFPLLVMAIIVKAEINEFDASRVSSKITLEQFARKPSATKTTNNVLKKNDIFKDKPISELNTKNENVLISRKEPTIRPENNYKKSLLLANISIVGNLMKASNKEPWKRPQKKPNEIDNVEIQVNEDMKILDLLRGDSFEANGPKLSHQTRHIYLGVPLYPYLFKESRMILPKNDESKFSHAVLYQLKQTNFKESATTEPSKIVFLSPGSFIPNADFNVEFFGGL